MLDRGIPRHQGTGAWHYTSLLDERVYVRRIVDLGTMPVIAQHAPKHTAHRVPVGYVIRPLPAHSGVRTPTTRWGSFCLANLIRMLGFVHPQRFA